MVRLILIGKRIYDKFSEDEMTVYAAQVSFFVILSFVPFLMLLLTAVQMIPGISKADFLEIAMDIVPADYKSLAFRVVNDLMLKSPATMISATAVTALWSAGRGMFSVARGLNRVNGRGRRHWYVFNRLICCGYTILFIAVCLMSMGLLVFGRTLQNFIQSHFPLIAPFTGYVIQLRQLWGAALVPDQKESVKVALPGAVFSTTGWMLFSLAFSLYFNFTGGKNYSYMYGSLAAIALSFLWLYICMCILFMGAELNWFWDEI